MARKVVREGTKVQEVVRQNPKTGANESFAVLPLQDLVEEYADKLNQQKKGMLDRVFGWFKGSAAVETDIAPDEKTTQLTTVDFGDLGVTRGYHERTKLEHVRRAKYIDYDRMDSEGTIGHRALDVTVNNAFMSQEGDQDSYEVDSKNNRVLTILKDLDHRTDLKEESPGIMRTGLKFGDSFEELCFDPAKRLIQRIAWINPMHVERNEDKFGRVRATKAFVQRDVMGDEVAAFQFWQVAHTRYNHQRGNRYGTSFYDSSRRPFKVLRVMEDGVAINRISRSVDRIVFYIPTDRNSTEMEKERIVAKAKKNFRKRVSVDSNGNMDLTRAPYGDSEDIYIGVESKDSPARVEMLKGSTIIGQLGDVEYFRNIEIMGYGVPKTFLQIEMDVSAKATLGHEDIEFGRMIRATQRTFTKFLRRVYNRQLEALGIQPQAELFTITWPAISFVDQKMRHEVELLKWQIAQVAKQNFGVPTPWLLKNVIGLDDDAIHEIAAGLEEPVPQQVHAYPGGPEIGQRGREQAREAYFGNRKLVADLAELKNMMTLVASERLASSMAA